MKIDRLEITIRDLTEGYSDDGEGGVVGCGGRLDIRPPYQREFIYGEDDRNAVIKSVASGFPLNVMYWAKLEDGRFEILDGQQRTISICQYVSGDFSVKGVFFPQSIAFHNLDDGDQRKIDFLDYRLFVYVCDGTPEEKLHWFETINIAGEQLADQELLSAVYSGSFVSNARRRFGRSGCDADRKGGRYLKGDVKRQKYLETVLKWHAQATRESEGHRGDLQSYLSKHQHDPDASEMFAYFESVVDWVQELFPEYRAMMRGLDWGGFYNEHKAKTHDPEYLAKRTEELIADPDVVRQPGIYAYLLEGETRKAERHLNIRQFDQGIKQRVYERQKRLCKRCKEKISLSDCHADHIVPWSKGGATEEENCQVLCAACNKLWGNR